MESNLAGSSPFTARCSGCSTPTGAGLGGFLLFFLLTTEKRSFSGKDTGTHVDCVRLAVSHRQISAKDEDGQI